MDYVSFHKLKATWDNRTHSGTSFSAPLFAGMCALVQNFFLQNAGVKLTHEQLDKFIQDNCIDLGVKGLDCESGYGLFVLPEPTTIDINKYCEVEEMKKYNSLEEVPEWGKPTIEKLMKNNALQGDENGNLYMSEEMLRILVINDRMGLYHD